MLLFFAACRQERDFIGFEFDPESVPSMITTQVETLISDSGITRFRLIADVWKVFDRASEPFWLFPEGFHVEQFDSLFNVEAIVVADSAWHYSTKRVWRLRNNVHLSTIEGDQLWSRELYWNQNDQWVSIPEGVPLRIQQANGVVTYGWGLESPQDLSDPEFIRLHDGRIPMVDTFAHARRNEDEHDEHDEHDESPEEHELLDSDELLENIQEDETEPITP